MQTMGPVADTTANLSGTLHGGPNPVVGATVTLYATTSGGYGAAATQLAQTTSGSYGQFGFTRSSYTCPTGQYAYITAVGGNTGSGTNANSVLVSALGACSTITQNTNIYISETTSVAAAYALAQFTSMTGTTVNIGAPATNNAATPACTAATGSTAASCTAAGLGHAFANALTLADSVEQSPAAPSGLIYTVTPSNANGSVPQALLNTVANAVFACVNSRGGAAGDGTSCGNLFTYTTPPTTTVASPTTPTNTFGALLSLAKYPSLTPANVTNLFALVPATPNYNPTLSAAPTDYSLAVLYKGVTIGGTTTAFTYPYFVTLDYNDNVFVASTASSSAGPLTFTGLTANGTSLFNGFTSTTFIAPRMMATDLAGNVFLPNNSATSGANVVLQLSSSTGALVNTLASGGTGAPYGIAVDASNRAYYTLGTANAAQALYSVLPSSSTTSTAVMPGGAAYTATYAPEALAFDAAGNLWNALYTASAGTYTNYLPNTGSLGTEAFGTVATASTQSTTASAGYGVVLDGSNNVWANNTKYLYQTAPGGTAPAATYAIAYTAPGATTATAASSARYPALDGLGNIFLPDNNAGSSKLWQYIPGTTSFVYFAPCAAPAGATACAAGSSVSAGGAGSLYGPRNAQSDSTGSIWVSSSTNGDVLQIIGPGAPTWPSLSLLKPGVRP